MISFKLSGRLCNVIREIYTCFWYCDKHKISFHNIRINKNFKDTYHKNSFPILQNLPFFKNIETNLYDTVPALQECVFSDNLPKSDNIIFTTNAGWRKVCNTHDIALFKQLYVNEQLFSTCANDFKKLTGNTEVTGLHVRRTDFITAWNGKHCKDAKYWNDQISNHDHGVILVCSDDIAWCKNNLNGHNLIFSENRKAYEDLIYLAMCNKLIKNEYSSFSDTAQLLHTCIKKDYII